MKSLDRLSKILDGLTIKEFRRLKVFLGHLRVNRRERTIKALNVIHTQLLNNTYPNEIQLQEALKLEIFNDRNANEQQFKNYLLDILLEVERYLVYDLMARDKYSRFRFLADAAEYRNLHEVYHRTLVDQRKYLKEKFEGNIWYFGYSFELSYKQYIHPFQNKYVDDDNRVSVLDNLNHITDFYLIIQLRLICEAIIYNSIVNPIEIPSLLLETLIEEKSNHNPTIELYFQLYQLFSGSIELDGNELIKFYKDNVKQITGRERMDFLLMLINYLSIQLNETGNKKLFKLLHELHKIGFPIENTENKKLFIDYNLYINIVQLGLFFDDDDWVDIFIETYKDFLPKYKNRETEIYQFCKAIFYIKREKYEDAGPILSGLAGQKNDDISFALKVKSFDIILQFEAEFLPTRDTFFVIRSSQALSDEITKSKDIHEHLKSMYVNFNEFVIHLTKDSIDYQKCIQKIENTPYVAAKSWLIEKANFLSNKSKKRVWY